MTNLYVFVTESNHIEGIMRPPTVAEMQATRTFVGLLTLDVGAVQRLVGVYQPAAQLRDNPSLNVRVGNHIAPRGGPEIVEQLAGLLAQISAQEIDVWRAHVAYEALHPFTDGNGRSGRAIWLWQMERVAGGTEIGFLHSFYYQTLSRVRLGQQQGGRE